MKDYLVLGSLNILAIILLFSIISLIIKKKIKVVSPKIVYTILALFPAILVVIPVYLAPVNKSKTMFSAPLTFLRCVYSAEMLLTLVIILLIVNAFPGSKIDNKDAPSSIKQVDSGVRLLQYSIFGNILYILPALALLLYIIYSYITSSFTQYNPIEQVIIIIYQFMLTSVLMQAYATLFICITSILTLSVIFFIMSINGIIRINNARKSKHINIKYIICMLLPIVNIVSMVYLCYSAKNKLGGYISGKDSSI